MIYYNFNENELTIKIENKNLISYEYTKSWKYLNNWWNR